MISSLTPPAILAETGPHLRAQASAITLRIWHHLADDEARLLLFEPFRTQDRSCALIEAILLAAADETIVFRVAIAPDQVRHGAPALVQAFGDALADIFGASARLALAPAWAALLAGLLDRIAGRADFRPV